MTAFVSTGQVAVDDLRRGQGSACPVHHMSTRTLAAPATEQPDVVQHSAARYRRFPRASSPPILSETNTAPFCAAMTQSQSPLASFDPFAAHPFTNTSGLMARPPPPSPYGVPSSFRAGSATSSQIMSPPPPTPRTPLTPPPRKRDTGVFVPFTPDRQPTPELEDILIKRRPQWARK
ncbi:hypothetical protein PENSPDRAFT_391653 [Peniophora sp. CONT]|nr:hypothetical protein PENSPDRAFT_391653 [Peniophora sp. CONT]